MLRSRAMDSRRLLTGAAIALFIGAAAIVRAQQLAVGGNRIVAVGTNQQIAQMATATTRRIDLRGRAVMPGLIDNHMHLLRAGTTWAREVRFDGVESRRQALDMVAARAKTVPAGDW